MSTKRLQTMLRMMIKRGQKNRQHRIHIILHEALFYDLLFNIVFIQFQERFRLGSTRKLNQIKILHVLTFYSDLRSFYLFASDKISCECCSPELGYCKLFTFDQRMRIIEGGTQQLGVDTGYFTPSFIHFVNTILHTVSSTKCALFKKSPNVFHLGQG